MAALESAVLNLSHYIKEHHKDLQPPVCNKMIYNDGELRIMLVGGPNQRKDYHMNQGEEVFYQIKGAMCLKCIEHGKPKDVVIKEGEIFVLPARVAHSPQRFEHTIGIVVERFRPEDELDGLAYFVDDTAQQVLWRRYFHVTDLGTQLQPLIAEFFASEEFKTRKPKDIGNPPWELNSTVTLSAPSLLASHVDAMKKRGMHAETLSAHEGEFAVVLLCEGEHGGEGFPITHEAWVWMLHGSCVVSTAGDEVLEVSENHSFLARRGLQSLRASVGAVGLLVYTMH